MNAIDQSSALSKVQQIQFGLLRLSRWPDIPQLPPEDMVDMARVCALLSWRATAGVIIARILEMPKDRVQEILLMLQGQDCLQVHVPGATQVVGRTAPDSANDSPLTEPVEPPPNSFITKIWQRLATRN